VVTARLCLGVGRTGEGEQPVAEPARRSTGDAARLNRASARRAAVRFGRNTPGIPPSRALSAGRLAALGAHASPTTACYAPCQPGASPPVLPVGASALTWVSPPAVEHQSAGLRPGSPAPTGRTGRREAKRTSSPSHLARAQTRAAWRSLAGLVPPIHRFGAGRGCGAQIGRNGAPRALFRAPARPPPGELAAGRRPALRIGFPAHCESWNPSPWRPHRPE